MRWGVWGGGSSEKHKRGGGRALAERGKEAE